MFISDVHQNSSSSDEIQILTLPLLQKIVTNNLDEDQGSGLLINLLHVNESFIHSIRPS